jgi:voltage-gated sodium channel
MITTTPSFAILRLVEAPAFQRLILILIVVNAIILGLETVPVVMSAIGPLLMMLDRTLLAIFVAELALKVIAYRRDFLRDPWNIFDLFVVGIALIPASGPLSVLRALRVLRVLRVISAIPSMRRVVAALLGAIPGIASILGLLSLVYYVFAVMAVKLFGAAFPEWFGSIPAAAYTLFQVMTLESWSMGIVRPVMEVHPQAWAFFLPFILVTTFSVLNLFIGIVVDAMQRQQADERPDPQAEIIAEIRALREDIAAIRRVG